MSLPTLSIALAVIVLVVALLALGRGWLAWVLPTGLLFGAWYLAGVQAGGWFAVLVVLWASMALLFGVRPLRRAILTPPLMRIVGGILPSMGDTEREALEAGTVWWDAELFSGRPRWRTLLEFQPQPLSERERAFLDGPVEELCRLVDDWEVIQHGDLPPEAWDFIKQHRFLGMIIPESYGGLGFSAQAHSAVITRLSAHCVTASVSVMVPNSLGPAELLLHYGTDDQKARWLPRLARGEEIPCFALTGPENGSDAAAMQARGIVCRGQWEGQEVTGLHLTWDKRYTTLAPVATLIGLAFRLFDPDRLLGGEEDLGITLALVPAHLPGIEIGERHDPLGVPFLNGPHHGRDVFVPLDAIIGGPARAGHGWRMLMDCLAAGRSISLPSLAGGSAQMVTRLTGAYASLREQFNLPIGRFEGVAERLARIAGLTYLMNAARTLTAGAVDAGEKPAVVSAICKCWLTESMRVVVNDGMDVLGGAGISRGPRNLLSRAYQAVPIGITVEGANILTRSLIVFGQGAIRCHPFAHEEMEAVAADDLPRFDRAFFSHINLVARNATRALLLGLTGGGAPSLPVSPRSRRLFGRCNHLCAVFALQADAAMISLGANLKRREMLSGRLADALAWLYLASATLKRHADAGEPEADAEVAAWATEHALDQARAALVGVLDNLPSRPLAWTLRLLCFPRGTRARPPRDVLSARVAAALLDGGELRLRLTGDLHVPAPGEGALAALDAALARVVAALPARRTLRDALHAGRLPAEPAHDLLARAVAAHVLQPRDAELLAAADRARQEAVRVDAFDADTYQLLRG